jgi:DNA repair protein RadB
VSRVYNPERPIGNVSEPEPEPEPEPETDPEVGPKPVSTGCAPLDDLLGGGFERGTVTQVYGPPAAGKTNIALSAAVQVAASGGTAVYLDTEGLSIERFRQLAAEVTDGDADLEAVTSRIVVTEAHDFAEQEEAVRDAADFASRAELVVLDSATGFYRLERHDDDQGETLRRVGRQVTHLLSLARKHDLAVVVTNQVFTDPDADRARALGGHTLNHWTGTVVRLGRFRGGNRRATLEKHRSKPAGETATFRITGDGLAGVEGSL